MDKYKRILATFIGIFLVVILWYSLLKFHILSNLLLPYPHDVANDLLEFLASKSFWLDLFNTILSWLGGVVLGTLLGVSLGLLLAINKYVWFAVEPIIEFFRSLPSIVLVPLVSLFFGVGLNSRLACSIIVVSVMIMSTIGISFRSINVSHKKLILSWKVSTYDKLIRIYLPESLSHILVAIKSSIPIALIVTVAADMLIATESGIGKIIMDSLAVFNLSKMYAAIIVVGILGYISALLSNIFDSVINHWKGK